MITLRPYQQTIVQSVNEAFSKAPKVLLQLPTGGGKTVIFCEIVKQYLAKNKKAIIVVHRKELLDQASAALSRLQIQHSLIAPGERVDPSHAVIVASVQSLNRRTLSFQPDILIIDEGHHAAGNNNWTKAIKKWPKAKTLGVTATPCRLDGKPLGNLFNILVSGPPTAELISQNYLAPVRVFSPQASVTAEGVGTRIGEYIQSQLTERFDTPEVAEEAVFNFKRICPDAKAIVFCCSVLHAEHTAQAFQHAGLSSACLHGKLSKLERESILQQFQEGIIQVITSRDLISEGTDIPDAQAAILLRPTKSESLYLQQVGRVLRTSPGKRFAFIIDLAGNTWKHGLPDEHREWSITRGLAKTKTIQLSRCVSCNAVVSKTQEFCGHCGDKNPDWKKFEEGGKTEKELASTPPHELARLEIEELNLTNITNTFTSQIHREIRLKGNRNGSRTLYYDVFDCDVFSEEQVEAFEHFLRNYTFISEDVFGSSWDSDYKEFSHIEGKIVDLLALREREIIAREKEIENSKDPQMARFHALTSASSLNLPIEYAANSLIRKNFPDRYIPADNNLIHEVSLAYKVYVGAHSRYIYDIKLEDLRFYEYKTCKLLTFYELGPLLQILITYYVPLYGQYGLYNNIRKQLD